MLGMVSIFDPYGLTFNPEGGERYEKENENGRNGILVEQNSGVNLGRDEGETIFDSPNTSVVGNGAYGLSCDTGGYADGRLGTLDGVNRKAASRFTKYCVDSLVHESHRYPDNHSR